MTTLAEKLHKWSLQELNIASESRLSRIPNVESFQMLTKGKNRKIWNYVINHVRSQATVNKVKRTLFLKKRLKEKQENSVYFASNSMDIEKLQVSLSKATERRVYLISSLSTIEDRILSLDQNIHKTEGEIFQINQKTALLEHLKQIYDEKNSNLKNLSDRILSFQSALNTYQTSKMFDKTLDDLSYNFLFENKILYDENLTRMKDLINITSNIFQKQFDEDDDDGKILAENFRNNFLELKNRGFLLTDFVVLLKEISRSEFQHFTAISSQTMSVKEYVFEKSKESSVNKHFAQLKYAYIYNSLSAKNGKDEIVKYSSIKSDASKNVMEKLKIEPNDFDYEIKLALLETQAENDALIASNNYFANYLEHIASKTDTVLMNIRQKKVFGKSVSSITQVFYKDADLTYKLLYTEPSVIKKASEYLNDIKMFVSFEMFKLPFPEEEEIEGLKVLFSSERKQIWDYCSKAKLIEPLFTESLIDSDLSGEVCRSLNIQPYHSLSVLCESWVCFKRKLHIEIAANAQTCEANNDVSVSEVYSNILKMLEKMKFSIEKGMMFVTFGTSCCTKNSSLVQEWWNQNAQYIPHIEYEGKTLKMWIDILSVLTDFELKA